MLNLLLGLVSVGVAWIVCRAVVQYTGMKAARDGRPTVSGVPLTVENLPWMPSPIVPTRIRPMVRVPVPNGKDALAFAKEIVQHYNQSLLTDARSGYFFGRFRQTTKEDRYLTTIVANEKQTLGPRYITWFEVNPARDTIQILMLGSVVKILKTDTLFDPSEHSPATTYDVGWEGLYQFAKHHWELAIGHVTREATLGGASRQDQALPPQQKANRGFGLTYREED